MTNFGSFDESSCSSDSDEDMMCNMRRSKSDHRNSNNSPKPKESAQSTSDSPGLKEKEFDSLFLDSLPEVSLKAFILLAYQKWVW